MLEGYKTYIAAALIMAASALLYFKVIDQHIFEVIFGLLTGAAFATNRAAIQRLQ